MKLISKLFKNDFSLNMLETWGHGIVTIFRVEATFILPIKWRFLDKKVVHL